MEGFMEESRIIPEDRVVYIDLDKITWGPWRVVQVSKERVTVLVDEIVTCTISRDQLRKV